MLEGFNQQVQLKELGMY